jgi:uncharacterized protein
LSCLVLTTYTSIAQESGKEDLCVGHYYTEEEAAQVIQNLKEEYRTGKEWLQRAEIIRRGILKGSGLSPLPQKTPLNPRFTEERKYEGYSVRNVAIESLPGVFVTGSLYLPEKMMKKLQVF